MSKCPTSGPCPVCRLLGYPYAGFMRMRNGMYRIGMKKSRSASVPVICVGNITTGGTGKTPMVAWVVDYLKQAGRTPAVLTRGYKSREGRSDEAQWLENATGARIVVNPDRVAGAKAAVESGADTLVMDDGFQHHRIRRDLDIVLVDATNPFGGGYCLPVGRLREPVSGLSRAGAIVITRSDQIAPESLANLKETLRDLSPNGALATAVHQPVSLINNDNQVVKIESIRGNKAFAFCGLGNPDGFFRTVESLEIEVCGRKAMPDHAHYSKTTVVELCNAAIEAGAEIALTTTKDGIKLTPSEFRLPLFQLNVEMKITEGENDLKNSIASAL